MRQLIFISSSIVLVAATAASQTYDDAGNPPLQTPATTSTLTPGDVLSTIPGPSDPNSGVAFSGSSVLVTSAYDGQALIYALDKTTGAIQYTVPTNDPGDFGLGYDHTRALYGTTKAVSSGQGQWR